MASLLKFLLCFTLLVMLFASINSHRDQAIRDRHDDGDNEEEEEDEKPALNDVKRLFLKYASRRNSSSAVLLIEHFEEIKMALLSQLNPENSGSFACYVNRLNELSVLLKRLNKTAQHNSYLDDSRFAKVSSVMIANFDRCYLGDSNSPVLNAHSTNHTNSSAFDSIVQSISNLYRQVVRNMIALKREVWIYALVSVTLISVIGALCVVIVPILNTCCFNYLFQFLTALAFGTLCGDALLHLIPHAFGDEDEISKFDFDALLNDEPQSLDMLPKSHQIGVYKGLAAVLGVYVFFFVESMLKLNCAKEAKKVTPRRKSSSSSSSHSQKSSKKSNKSESGPETYRLVNPTNFRPKSMPSDDRVSNYDNMFDESLIVVSDNLATSPKRISLSNNRDSELFDKNLEGDFRQHKENVQNPKIVRKQSSQRRKRIKEPEHEVVIEENNENEMIEQNGHITNNIEESPKKTKTTKNHHHNHNHKHEHHHHHHHHNGIKSSIFMIVIGDALHNFSDGLAIGASFAASLTTGFGTTIAVFFHELPHEIGDFAVLRNNGLSLKRALFFNIVSSILCFFGVLIGLLIGSIESFATWSFLFIAGTFLYVSLVDIIPELNESKRLAHYSNFFLQNLGVLLGFGIMLLIALYENDIVNMIKLN